MRSKRLVAVLAASAVALAAGGVFAVNHLRGSPEPAYITATAQVADVEDAVMATGTLQPAQVVDVGAQTSGQIMSMKVQLGDRIEAGELIAVVEAFQLQNQIRRAENQIRQATARLNATRGNLALQEGNLAREEALMEKGVGTQLKLDQARNQVANARSTLTERENDLRNQQINLADARNNLERSNVRAPISGVVAEMVAREGQTINTNREVPTIVKLAKTDVMTVRAQISEADIIKVRPGLPVYFTVLGDPDRRYHATLLTRELTPAGGVLDPTEGGLAAGAVYYNVLFEVENTDGVLFPGMTADVRVVLDEVTGVLTIPAAALVRETADDSYLVEVVESDGSIDQREVMIGLANNTMVEIRDGLQAGEQVIIGQADEQTAIQGGGSLFGALTVPKS